MFGIHIVRIVKQSCQGRVRRVARLPSAYNLSYIADRILRGVVLGLHNV